MFEGMWTALKRWWDLSAVPALIAVIMYVAEKLFGLMGWIFVLVGDFLVGVVSTLFSFLPVPDSVLANGISESTFGAKFLDVAQVIGLWPAALVYFSFAVVALISRIATLGIVGNQ